MWNSRKRRTLCTVFWLALLSWSFLAGDGGHSYAAEPEIVISETQYRTLKETAQRLKAELILQETRIKTLESSSTTSTEKLAELKSELADCKTKLASARSSLEKSDEEMKNAKASLETLNEHLQMLNSKIASLEHKLAVTRRQRNLWVVIGAISLGAVAIRGL